MSKGDEMQSDLFQPEPKVGWCVEFMVIIHNKPIGEDLDWLPLYILTVPVGEKTECD